MTYRCLQKRTNNNGRIILLYGEDVHRWDWPVDFSEGGYCWRKRERLPNKLCHLSPSSTSHSAQSSFVSAVIDFTSPAQAAITASDFPLKKKKKNQSTYKYEQNADSFCIVTGQDGANFNHSVIVRLIKVANVSVISQSASFPLSLIAIIYFVYLFSNWPSKCTPWTDWILS